MKKYVIIIVFLSMMCSIYSVEFQGNTKTRIHNINLSYGIASGGSIGIGKIQHFEKSTKEITANFHYLKNSDYFVTGIYGQINSYRNEQRKGFFTLLIIGLDYSKGEYVPISFGGNNRPEKFESTIPNFAIGCGCGLRLSPNNRMLIYFDLGLKKTISNLNLSITF